MSACAIWKKRLKSVKQQLERDNQQLLASA
jgi:hypothetical protein